jgi:hypothetical protein
MVPVIETQSPTVALLGTQQRELAERVAAANTPGNLEGLFALHVIGRDPSFPLAWDIECVTESWLVANGDRFHHFPILATLGYSLSLFPTAVPAGAGAAFATGAASLRTRPPFPSDRITFAYQPVAFLGLALGAAALGEQTESCRAWLLAVVNDRRLAPPTAYHALLYSYIRFVLSDEAASIDDLHRYVEAEALALVEWGIQRGAFRLVDLRADLSALQARILVAGSLVDSASLTPARAAVLWSAIHSSLVRSVEGLVLSRNHVTEVLRRFEDALRRWRWDRDTLKHPIRWPITSEREVQDIVWVILRSLFDDVVDEDALPKLGHSTYRADFGIPSLRMLVEVKYARGATDFKDLEKELLEDSVAYLIDAGTRYDRILVFIYDHSASVQEHGLTVGALRRLAEIEDVIIVSRPSHLPTSDTSTQAD